MKPSNLVNRILTVRSLLHLRRVKVKKSTMMRRRMKNLKWHNSIPRQYLSKFSKEEGKNK